jgi:molecular chaperone DnaK
MRPYATLDAFLAEEQDTFSRTAVTLIGAPSRPRGVVIRFEITLSDATPILRGEGRVLSYQGADEHGPSSLTLRFTRLDARSKALVDRIAANRESGVNKHTAAAAAAAPPPPTSSEEAIDPLAATSMGVTLPASLDGPPPNLVPPPAMSSGALLPAEAISAPTLPDTPAPPPRPPASDSVSSVPDREALLEKLRNRAKGLSPSQVATILTRPQ